VPNENETNLNNDTVNIDENVPTESANEEMSSENVALKKSESKIRKTKKVSNKKSSDTKKKKKKKTKKNDVKKTDKKMDDKKTDKQHKKAGKITTKSSSKKKSKKIETSSSKKKSSKNIEDELQKVTNIKSIEQIKKPQKIALMVAFYTVIVIAILTFCLIRFSKPKNTNLLIEESINYEFLTEEIVSTSEKNVEESSTDTDDIKNDSQQNSDLLLALTTKSADSYKSDTENKDESINKTESTKQIENKKTIEETIKKQVEETTKKQVEETTKKQTEETSKKKVEETTKKQVESTEKIETKAWPKRSNVNDILPRYKEVIYPYPVFNQMSLEEIGLINNAITENYNTIKDKVFGEDISFANKGTNGILYLNYTYLQQFIETYTSTSKQSYEQLPVAPYYNYIMNDKFNFNYKTYTTNLNMKLDFKNAKNQGQYFEVPATIYEPTGSSVSSNGINKINVRVLKKAKVGYTESFSLTSLLEVLDIECHTKHNPFFDIEDLIGTNPKAITDMRESGFDVRNMIDEEIFNYVMFDKKGYITALYMLKS
jgi:hypothetical protein